MLILPLLGNVKVPTEPEKKATLFGLHEKPQIAKQLLAILLDMLLLPYGWESVNSVTIGKPLNYTIFRALSPSAGSENDQGNNSSSNVSLPIPPGMSEVSFKRVTHENPMKPEDLEQV